MTHVLSEKAMLANLTVRGWGVRRRDREATEEVLDKRGAEKDAGLFTKRLLNKNAIKDLHAIMRAARTYHNEKTMPWLEDGTRIIPTGLYLPYAGKMQEYRNEFAHELAEFVKAYPDHIQQAKKELGSLFDPTDYPAQALVGKKFAIDIIIMPCPDTADFRVGLNGADMKQLKADLDKALQEQLNVALKDVGGRVAVVVKHMAERLKAFKPKKGKEGKIEGNFRDTLVTNIKEIADLIPAFNISNDPDLAAIHKRLVKELCHTDADTLREDDAVRKRVLTSAEQILKEVSAFIK